MKSFFYRLENCSGIVTEKNLIDMFKLPSVMVDTIGATVKKFELVGHPGLVLEIVRVR